MNFSAFLKIILILAFLVSKANYAAGYVNHFENDSIIKKDQLFKKNLKNSVVPTPPTIKVDAENQIYCPAAYIKIAHNVVIDHDPSEIGTKIVNIQVAAGYSAGDALDLSNAYKNATPSPKVKANFISAEGKLILSSTTLGAIVSYDDFKIAIENVEFYSTSSSPSGVRDISISLGIGTANYLPRNGHFYEYVTSPGITWTEAKTAAAASAPYYGLRGYLATLTAADEAQLAGAQAPGTGWIGASDAEFEGTWKWVTGPEGLLNGGTGITFWIGKGNGIRTAPFNYDNWNKPNEPNDSGSNEDYAHITDPAVGNKGTWNDLPNAGNGISTNYFPKGYIVEYGGMGEAPLQISTSTTITIPTITATKPNSRCGSGIITLEATASSGTVNWYDAAIGGNSVSTSSNYTTPFLTTTTTYYVSADCTSSRTAVTATINTVPIITNTNSPVSRCGAGAVTLEATITSGTVNWYSSLTGRTSIGTGTSFTTNISQNTTFYAEGTNNGCGSTTRVSITAVIINPPIVTDQEVIICKSGKLVLDAQLPNLTYLWTTGEITQTVEIITSGSYSVKITNAEGCSSVKKINVIEHESPEIDRIDVNETTVVIYLRNTKDYFEYSVDGINYQSSNVFYNVTSGLQTAYIREPNTCGSATANFIVLLVPRFFTPNNDSFNDFWEIKGLVNYPDAQVTIFDRYGKLIRVLNAKNSKWDGTFNKSLLPSDDYWYSITINDYSPEKKGHFTLKR